MSDENKLPIAESILEDFDKDKVEKDYEYSRSTYYDLVEKGREAIEMMIEVARDSEHPRAYEVLSKLIKDTSDVNGELMDLNKKRKDVVKNDPAATPEGGVTNNNVFVGSTTELQRYLDKIEKDKLIDVTPKVIDD